MRNFEHAPALVPSCRYSTRRTIGIVGGQGPHAHIEFERLLLAATVRILGRWVTDQDYPSWIVASQPRTPDRSVALLEDGPSPVPSLLRSLQSLTCTSEGMSADFAVMICNTAHAFLPEIWPRTPLPILDIIELTVREAARRLGAGRVGLLGTDGTCRSNIFQAAVRRAGLDLDIFSLLDLPGGDRLQESCVMTPVYGPLIDGRRPGGGIKSGILDESMADALREGVRRLAGAGAKMVICGCTEIPLVLRSKSVDETGLIDPMHLAAERAVSIALGRSALPDRIRWHELATGDFDRKRSPLTIRPAG